MNYKKFKYTPHNGRHNKLKCYPKITSCICNPGCVPDQISTDRQLNNKVYPFPGLQSGSRRQGMPW